MAYLNICPLELIQLKTFSVKLQNVNMDWISVIINQFTVWPNCLRLKLHEVWTIVLHKELEWAFSAKWIQGPLQLLWCIPMGSWGFCFVAPWRGLRIITEHRGQNTVGSQMFFKGIGNTDIPIETSRQSVPLYNCTPFFFLIVLLKSWVLGSDDLGLIPRSTVSVKYLWASRWPACVSVYTSVKWE